MMVKNDENDIMHKNGYNQKHNNKWIQLRNVNISHDRNNGYAGFSIYEVS